MDEGFEELLRRHLGDAFRFALGLTGDRQEAEDLAQEGFARAWRAYPSFRGDASFRTWLFTILVHAHRDRLRRLRAWNSRVARLPRPDEAVDPGFSEVDAEDLRGRILELIRRLPPRQREVLTLHAVEGFDYHQIAKMLGITYQDVKVNLSLARRRLKEMLP